MATTTPPSTQQGESPSTPADGPAPATAEAQESTPAPEAPETGTGERTERGPRRARSGGRAPRQAPAPAAEDGALVKFLPGSPYGRIVRKELDFFGRRLIVETGKIAGQADGSVTVQYGDTVVLATAVMAKTAREGIDFFPLTVDYEERQYAAGKIPGGYPRRETRPRDEAVLIGRLIDRPLRPLFPKGMRNDVQIIVTTLSYDQENDPGVLGIVGASCALTISDIPWSGPIGGVRMGSVDGKLVVNPTESERERSDLDLVIAATADAVMMVEAGANRVSERLVLDAIRQAHEAIRTLCQLQEELRRECGKSKREFTPAEFDPEVEPAVDAELGDRLTAVLNQADKTTRDAGLDALTNEVLGKLSERFDATQIVSVVEGRIKDAVRAQILTQNQRPDGRDSTTLRPILCEVGVLPRTHGSALFTRGQTQALSIATLGSPGDAQQIETLHWEDDSKRYLHHYNFPPYSTGETGRLGAPSRRSIGHGHLAERALVPVLPPAESFPYTLRVVSEIVSSNGSTSMASVCGSTLSLMDAGVPLAAPVAGVAMGLVLGSGEQAGKHAVLTDILGMEDALGDMDFKVAGTADGITALQMDIKVKGITPEIMEEALEQARHARLAILAKMKEAIAEPRPSLSQFAPKMVTVRIPQDKIGAIIGPGGKTIRRIQEETGSQIDIDDSGLVNISSPLGDGAERAAQIVRSMTEEVEVGKIYLGKITRLMNFGAFAEILPGKEGLIHISELAEHRVNRVEDVVEVGDEVMVMVTEIDPQGRVNLSRRAVIEGQTPEDVASRKREMGPPGGRGGFGGGPRGPRGPFGPGGGGFNRNRSRDEF
ncbi:MAG TPA: polyribonucleotide nucleotidyltransferase [Chloroflexota bacterium]|nr:polyribonucleotide nucleotidyltransferase [Chloroflexota bacterium]